MKNKFDGLRLTGIERDESWRGGYAMYGMGRMRIRRRSLAGQRAVKRGKVVRPKG